MKYARRFLMSFVAGAGSAIGAFIGKECMVMVKNVHERKEHKKKSNDNKYDDLKEGEES